MNLRSDHALPHGSHVKDLNHITADSHDFSGSSEKASGYRKDIDGLRAVAVTAVVLDHAGFPLFAGGFVGVDVFFVISGFLITGILDGNFRRGTFSLVNFYVRRIKRLMPALLAVIGVTSAAAVATLFPGDLLDFSRSVLAVLAYSGNFYFWIVHGGYFGGNAQETLLLHTWSLAVEEQFYFVWPATLYLLLKFCSRPVALSLSASGCLVFLWLSEWGTANTIGAAYYLLPTRMYELMIGSILALAWSSLPLLRTDVRSAISFLGLALIAYAVFSFDSDTSFPGFNSLYPTVGATLLIISGQRSDGPLTALLSARPIVYIGLISYSLYLCHWPIFALARYRAFEVHGVVAVALIALSVLCAHLTWQFVEKPIRNSKEAKFPKIAIRWTAAPIVVAAAFLVVLQLSHGLDLRFSRAINDLAASYEGYQHKMRSSCHASLAQANDPPSPDCSFGSTASATHALLLGDSHANHLFGFLEVLGKDGRVAIQDYTLDQCPPLVGLDWGRSPAAALACRKRNDIAFSRVDQGAFSFVILGASWPSGGHRLYRNSTLVDDPRAIRSAIVASLSLSIERIAASGAVPIVFDDIPHLVSGADPRCPLKRAVFRPSLQCKNTFVQNAVFEEAIAQAVRAHPNTVRIHLSDLFCSGSVCDMEITGVPLYIDGDHLTYLGSQRLGELLLLRQGNFLRAGELGPRREATG